MQLMHACRLNANFLYVAFMFTHLWHMMLHVCRSDVNKSPYYVIPNVGAAACMYLYMYTHLHQDLDLHVCVAGWLAGWMDG